MSYLNLKKYIRLLVESDLSDALERIRARRRGKSAVTAKYDPELYDIGIVYQKKSGTMIFVVVYKKFLGEGRNRILNDNIIKSNGTSQRDKYTIKVKDPKNLREKHLSYLNLNTRKRYVMPFEVTSHAGYNSIGIVECLAGFDASNITNWDDVMSKYIRPNLGSASSQIISADALKSILRNYNLPVSDARDMQKSEVRSFLKGKVDIKMRELKEKLYENLDFQYYHTMMAMEMIFGIDGNYLRIVLANKEQNISYKTFLLNYYENYVKDELDPGQHIEDDEVFMLSHASTKIPDHIWRLSKYLREKGKSKEDGNMSPKEISQDIYNKKARAMSNNPGSRMTRDYIKKYK
jgi:hypothetical protein